MFHALHQFLKTERALYLYAGIIGLLSLSAGSILYIFQGPQYFALGLIFIGLLEVLVMFPSYFRYPIKIKQKQDLLQKEAAAFVKSEINISHQAIQTFVLLKRIYGSLFLVFSISLLLFNMSSWLSGLLFALCIHLAFAIGIDYFGEKFTKIYLSALTKQPT
ncbi:hypothetical protein DNU06_15595 [Putridiphycobacter roseus]|uniref:Uncharacterized protein n=1 Tax=Putridiphycobacter roseus TaxID=2219161 RepID=A0A2W1MZB3_9FLAO|nr:hypothetical protein [Putridiphycobacter roseus]PZE15931.1 hypothetical protein DNU06_15595 [Putridiphycobacter roseus]